MKETDAPTVNRNNWHKYCTEPKLSQDEIQELLDVRRNLELQPKLASFVRIWTKTERAAIPNTGPGTGWDQFAVWAAANRRLQRAEIAAWRQWQEQ